MRRGPDGSFFLPRPVGKEALIKKMDAEYIRVPGEFRWLPRAATDEVTVLKDKFINCPAYIVGKGPSLDQLKFLPDDGPVIAINEALHKVETLTDKNVFGIIQDHGVQVKPKRATLLLNHEIRGWYDFWNQKHHFEPKFFGLKNLPVPISAVMAIKIAEWMGCNSITMIGFDACTGGSVQYASAVGHPPSGNPSRFKSHRQTIDNCTKLPINWIQGTEKPEIFVTGMQGMGDALIQRGHIKELIKTHSVYLMTPWPQFYYDLPVKCVKYNSEYTTYKLNEQRFKFTKTPYWAENLDLRYKPVDARKGLNLFESMGPVNNIDLTIPIKEEWIKESYKFVPEGAPFILLRPPTLRKEWYVPTRSPKKGYFKSVVLEAKKDHLPLVSVAALSKDEWIDGDCGPVDIKYHKGEVPQEIVLTLMFRARYSITTVGFGYAMAMALNSPTFVIFGGQAGPEWFSDKRLNNDKVWVAAPRPFCQCFKREHNCNKEIPDLIDQFAAFKRGVA